MCAELFRIPVEVGGVPIFGFGVLLALWLAAGCYAAYRNARAGNSPAEGWLSLLIGAVVIVMFPRFFPDGFPLRSYGLMLLCGSGLGLWMAIYRARQRGIDGEEIIALAMGMFVLGIVGARLFYVIEYWEPRIRQATLTATIKEALSYTEGGLVVYGSLIGATLAFVWFCWRKKWPPLAMADIIAPSLVAGLALGRIGCLMNGCCYGGETDAALGISFPRYSIAPRDERPGHFSGPYLEQFGNGGHFGFDLRAADAAPHQPVVADVTPNSPAAAAGLQTGDVVVGINRQPIDHIDDAQALLNYALRLDGPLRLSLASGKSLEIDAGQPPLWSRKVHPTQVYSSVHAALLAWVLWSFYPFRRAEGQVTALMLTIYPVSRYFLEEIRIDESPVFGTGLSISQNISVALLFLAGGLWIYLWRAGREQVDFTSIAAQNT